MRRLELETRANFERWTVSLLYGNYDKQPELGFLNRREGLLGTASFKVAANWVVSGGVRYDLKPTRSTRHRRRGLRGRLFRAGDELYYRLQLQRQSGHQLIA